MAAGSRYDPDHELGLPPDDLDEMGYLVESAEVDYLVGSCQCGWRGSGMFFRGDTVDKYNSKDELLEEHAKTGCTRNPHIGIM